MLFPQNSFFLPDRWCRQTWNLFLKCIEIFYIFSSLKISPMIWGRKKKKNLKVFQYVIFNWFSVSSPLLKRAKNLTPRYMYALSSKILSPGYRAYLNSNILALLSRLAQLQRKHLTHRHLRREGDWGMGVEGLCFPANILNYLQDPRSYLRIHLRFALMKSLYHGAHPYRAALKTCPT